MSKPKYYDRAKAGKAARPHYAIAKQGLRHVFIRDLRLMARIGTRPKERQGPQPLIINLDLAVWEGGPTASLKDVVCYEAAIGSVKRIIGQGHIDLVETLAEQIAEACLVDSRVASVRVRIEKPKAVRGAKGAGVEIERSREQCLKKS
jgi:dihydroneopterin aldolase